MNFFKIILLFSISLILGAYITTIYFHENKFATHIVMTFIDDCEPDYCKEEIDANGKLLKLGAITNSLLAALLEEECVIIACSSLMNNLTRYLEEVSDNPFKLIPKKTINPSHWIKKEISEYLSIFIPKEYASSIASYKKFNAIKPLESLLSAQELALGIIFENKKTVTDEEFLKPSTYHPKDAYPVLAPENIVPIEYDGEAAFFAPASSPSWISQHFIKLCIGHEIFITNQNYYDLLHHMPPIEIDSIIPQPVIIADGHGTPYIPLQNAITRLQWYKGPHASSTINQLKKLLMQGKTVYQGGQIAGFNSKDFGTFLKFLADNLSVKLFFFNTCFGTEINIQEALNSTEKRTSSKTATTSYPFTIISGAVNNATAFGIIQTSYSKSLRDIETRGIVKPLLKKFLKTLNKSAQPTHQLLRDALKNIYSLHFEDNSNNNNIPLIKECDLPWQPLVDPKTLVTLDDIFVKKQGTLPCDLTHLAPSLDLIFIEACDISSTVIISTEKAPSFISTKPGNCIHHFKALQACKIPTIALFKAFFTLVNLQETKAFIIDILTTKNAYNQKELLQDVLIINYAQPCEPAQQMIFYTLKEELIKITFEYDRVGVLKKIITKAADHKEYSNLKNELPTARPFQ